MINYIKKHFSIRTCFIIGVATLIISNFIFIFIYYNILLNNQINKNYEVIKNELQTDLNHISKEINDNQDLNDYLNNYAKQKNINIIISDINNQEIKNYNKFHKFQVFVL